MMKTIAIIGVLLALAVTAVLGQVAASPEVQLKAAIHKEQVEGDLRGAVEQFRKLSQSPKRAVAARALVHLGACAEKLGEAEARQAYEQVVAKFPDQTEALAQARARLAALAAPTTAGVDGGQFRLSLDPYVGSSDGVSYPISRDGRYFASLTATGQALRIRDLMTGEDRTLALGDEDGRAQVSPSSFSPDGRRLAYVWMASGGTGREIRVIPTSGGTPPVFVGRANLPVWTAWSPDGREVYLSAFRGAPFDVLARTAVSLSDGTVRQLADAPFVTPAASGPAYSPDSRYMAYARWTNYARRDLAAGRMPPAESYVVVTDLQTGKETPITDGHTADRGPVWTPDSSQVLFVRDRNGESSLWSAATKGGQAYGIPVLLRSLGTATAAIPGEPAVRPVGMTANGAYHYVRDQDTLRGYVVGVDPGHKVTNEAALAELPFACSGAWGWAPDGQAIAIVVPADGRNGAAANPCSGERIVIRSIAGGSERAVKPGLREMRRPRWSPDGRNILVAAHQDKTYGLYLVDVASGAPRLLVKTPSWDAEQTDRPLADWTPDGKSVVIGRFTAADGAKPAVNQLVYRDVGSGQETVRYTLTGTGVGFSLTSIAPDGSACLSALLRPDDKSIVRAAVIVPPVAGEPRVVFSGRWQDVGVAGLSADGKGVWITQRKPTREAPKARGALWVPIDGGQPVDSGLTMEGLDVLSPSPDGSKLLLLRQGRVPQLWTLENILSKAKTAAGRH